MQAFASVLRKMACLNSVFQVRRAAGAPGAITLAAITADETARLILNWIMYPIAYGAALAGVTYWLKVFGACGNAQAGVDVVK